MTDFIKFSLPTMAHEAVQSLLEGKRQARSLENTVDALIPLISNEDTAKQLEEGREALAKIGGLFQRLYTRNAREVFGVGEVAGSIPRGGKSAAGSPTPDTNKAKGVDSES